MQTLEKLPNIGHELAKRLKLAGIRDYDHLVQTGTEQVFIKLRTVFPNTCINTLYAIDGAIAGIRWHNLDQERKEQLKTFYDLTCKSI